MKAYWVGEKRKKLWKRVLSLSVVLALLAAELPSNITLVQAADTATGEESISENTYQDNETFPNVSSVLESPEEIVEAKLSTESEAVYLTESETVDIFDNTTITLSELTLQASYKDADGKTEVITLSQDKEFSLPYNADINMTLKFLLGDATAVSAGTTYLYTLPDTIRVDVEADHELSDPTGKDTIGKVHISKDGTLAFQFYTDTLGTNTDVSFYVQFEGGFSEDYQAAGTEAEISFPTSGEPYDFSVKITDKTSEEEETEPGDIGMSKTGSRIISDNGQNYIEWTIDLDPNGRKELSGTIHDVLPEGLTYAAISGYPKLEGEKWGSSGSVSTSAQTGDSVVDITLTDCTPDWHSYVKFCTYYDAEAFDLPINNDTSAEITNQAVYTPDDGTKQAEGTGTVSIKPNMLSKTGSAIDADGKITWTVTINQEGLNIDGATYQDTLGDGLSLLGNTIEVTSQTTGSSVTPTVTDNGFSITFPDTNDTYILTYQTEVTDFSQSSYTNGGTLQKNTTYNVSTSATVNGLNLLRKSSKGYEAVTNTFTWEIVVNEAGKDIKDVTVTDTFASDQMEFVSASVTPTTTSDGKLVFHFDELTGKQVITVVTKLKNPDDYADGVWHKFSNDAAMTSSLNTTTPVTAQADNWAKIENPNLLDKEGKLNGDGTVEWTVKVNKPDLTVEGITFTDVLPQDMTYVEGSFHLQNWYYDSAPVYIEPKVSTDSNGIQTITYALDANENVQRFYDQSFWIVYQTKITDIDKASESNEYTNHAEINMEFAGDIEVSDEDEATVTGVVGGVLNKTYSYKTGTREVEWTVTINEARNDMSNINNPKITDVLADYFDYVSGTLYKIDAQGNATEVNASDYKIAVVNGTITVLLPNIGSDCYQFKFKTMFKLSVASGQVENKDITNTVTFLGEGVEFTKESDVLNHVSFNSSTAGSLVKREIRVKKVDSVTGAALQGAEFELYLDGVKVGEAVSDADGLAVFESGADVNGYQFVLKEIQAPEGYTIDKPEQTLDCTEAIEKTSGGVIYYEFDIPNTSTTAPTGDIVVEKVNDAGTALSGAVFGLYQDAACKDQIASKTTASNGKLTFGNLEQGTYYVKEITPPKGYKLSASNNAVKVDIRLNTTTNKIEVAYDDTVKDSIQIENEKAVGSLVITKVESNSSTTLNGAAFSLYKDENCTIKVDTQTTTGNGIATFDNLELGRTYYYREVTAPTGYVLDNTVHAITVGTGTETSDQTKKVTVENEKAVGNIVITKVDNSAPAKTLAGVGFTLYQAGDLATPYKAEVLTDANGIATFSNLPFGDYVIRETSGKTGYAVKSTDTNVTVSAQGDTAVTIVNEQIKCNIKITKVAKEDNSQSLSGATIGLYNSATGLQVATKVTNADGEVYFYDIPSGQYYVQEIKAPEGYKLNDTKIDITEEHIKAAYLNNGVLERSIEDTRQNGKILLQKNGQFHKDDGSIDVSGLAGAEFTLFDANMMEVARATSMTADEATEAAAKGVTGAVEGSVYFEGLAFGTYYVQETKAPDGYIRDTDTYQFVVDRDDTVIIKTTQSDGTLAADALTIVNRASNAPYISFKLKKINSDTKEGIANATFGFYKDGVLAVTAVSDAEGVVYFKRVSVTDDPDTEEIQYTIREISAPTGYQLDDKWELTLGNSRQDVNKYADPLDSDNPNASNLENEDILWVGGSLESATVENTPIKGAIQITKTGTSTSQKLEGAEYTLYGEDKTTVVKTAVTDKNGLVTFDELPCGIYYVKETKAPKGYTLNATETKVVITDEKLHSYTYKDETIEVRISKRAVNGSAELQGAVFNIYESTDTSKTVLDTWTSTDYASHRIPYGVLEAGKTYVLTEVTAPDGYGYTDDILFTVNKDGSITTSAEKSNQTIIVRDSPATLKISKQDNTGANLANAILAIYDSNQKEVMRFTTNGSIYEVPLGSLKVPKPVNGNTTYNYYTLKEISAPDGYAVAQDIRFAVASTGAIYKVNTITGNIGDKLDDSTLTMVDEKKSGFYIRKLNGYTYTDLAGAELQFYDTADQGMWLNTQITSGRPLAFSAADGEIFTLKELNAPDGYLVADPVKFEIKDGKIEILEGNAENVNADGDTILLYDTRIELKISKQNSYGTILKGATLRLSEYDEKTEKIGAKVDEFVSDGVSAHDVDPTLLKVGTSYILQEIGAPDGYQIAEDIIFKLGVDGSITRTDKVSVYNHTIVMEDEVGLSIGKVSLEDGEGLAGSHLQVTAVDDPYFTTRTWVSDGFVKTWDLVAFTPGCTYILTELNAPDGYAYADPITFTLNEDDHQVYVDGEAVDNRTIHIADGKLKLTVSKQDTYAKTAIAGAQMAVLDEQEQVVVSWTSGTEDCQVDTSKLIAGKEDNYQEYILRELTAPEGYETAADIRFAIDKYGDIYLVTGDGSQKKYTPVEDNRLVMYDEPLLSVRKLDTSGNPVIGAQLTITAKEDADFTPISWVSTEVAKYFEADVFTPGVTYVLTETEAPKGYTYAQSIEFQVDADGKVTVNGVAVENKRIVMLDYPIKVYVSKQDEKSQKALAGAKLVIKDAAGDVICNLVSTEEAILLPSEIFTAPKTGSMQYYTLSELEAPEGYLVADDIAFAIDTDGNVYQKNEQGDYKLCTDQTLIMLDVKKDNEDPNTTTTTPDQKWNIKLPKTGDNTPLGMMLLLCIIGFAGACVTFGRYVARKRRKMHEK